MKRKNKLPKRDEYRSVVKVTQGTVLVGYFYKGSKEYKKVYDNLSNIQCTSLEVVDVGCRIYTIFNTGIHIDDMDINLLELKAAARTRALRKLSAIDKMALGLLGE